MKKILFYNEVSFRVITPVVIGFVAYLLVLMFFDSLEQLNENFFSREVLFTVGLSFLFFEANRLVIVLFNKLFKDTSKVKMRALFQIFSSLLVSSLVVSTSLYIYFVYLEGFTTLSSELRTFNSIFFLIAIFYHLYFFSLFYLNRKNEALISKEKRKRAIIEAEFQSYKNQINPNFLFESLEIILNQLYVDTDQADKLITELSRMYRYALDNQSSELLILESEIEVLKSLEEIFKAKYPSSLTINLRVKSKDLERSIVPLSLIILTEIALSENMITPDRKLEINISSENDGLVFSYFKIPKIADHISSLSRLEKLKKSTLFYSSDGIIEKLDNNTITYFIPLIDIEELIEA